MLLLALLVVLGNRAGGSFAAGALILAQVTALMIVWWIPDNQQSGESDQVGQSVAFGLGFFVVLSYAYQLVFLDARVFLPLKGQTLTLYLVAVIVFGAVLLGWRDGSS